MTTKTYSYFIPYVVKLISKGSRQKKVIFFSGSATKRRGGVLCANKEKRTFFVAVEKLNMNCVRRHIQISTYFLKYLPKNMALLVNKLWRKKKFNPYPAISRRKKNPASKSTTLDLKEK